MDLFGKKASDLQSRLDSALEDLERSRKDMAAAQKRTDAALEARRTVEDERTQLKTRVSEAELARDKARDSQAKAEQMVRWLQDKQDVVTSGTETAKRERDEAVAKAVEAVASSDKLRREADELRAELARAADQLEKAQARAAERAARPPRPETDAPAPVADTSLLKAEVDGLRRELADHSERLRGALRKAEHNRRAYLITQMQLDMAEDRIHLLTKGTPRPVHVDRDVDASDGPVEAEDVEGFEESAAAPAGPEVGQAPDPIERAPD